MKGEEEQESEQSGEDGAEEEGTESDLVGATIFTQANCANNQSQQVSFFFFTPLIAYFLRKVVFASELRVKFKEEIEEENKSRQCLAQAIKEKKEKDKGQRWSSLH